MTEPKTKRNFTVVGKDGSESGIFTAAEPKKAAKKAVHANFEIGAEGIIRIRERGTHKIKEYTFKVGQKDLGEGGPAWNKGETVKDATLYYVRTYSSKSEMAEA